MEFYESKLTLFCRLCGGKITLSRGYSDATVEKRQNSKKSYKHAYTIDIEQIFIHHLYVTNVTNTT